MSREIFHKCNAWGKAILKAGILLIASMLISFSSQSQYCLPEGITFTTQSQIDSFQINYPGCAEIEGHVQIGKEPGSVIIDLSGLSVLTSIGGYLYIYRNIVLTSLTGLDNVTSIGGYIDIGYNHSLKSLMALEGLTSIGGDLRIYQNDALTSLTGLDNVTSIGEVLRIIGNISLTSLTGLGNVTSIGGYISIVENQALTSLTGLENVTSIGGFISIAENPALLSITALKGLTSMGGALGISQNNTLISLSGIDNIEATSITSLHINYNNSLSSCAVLSVCDFITNPGGEIYIFDNATGCNSQLEVEDSCGIVAVSEFIPLEILRIYPNPTTTQITISGAEGIIDEINIYNRMGQQVFHEVNSGGTIDVSTLPQGLYFVEIFCDNHYTRQKLLIQK